MVKLLGAHVEVVSISLDRRYARRLVDIMHNFEERIVDRVDGDELVEVAGDDNFCFGIGGEDCR